MTKDSVYGELAVVTGTCVLRKVKQPGKVIRDASEVLEFLKLKLFSTVQGTKSFVNFREVSVTHKIGGSQGIFKNHGKHFIRCSRG